MKVLILEDSAERMLAFNERFRNWEVYHVEHAQDAVDLLKKNEFDLICLDHDLGGKQMQYDREDCGMIVAEYLHANPVKARIVIHSFNTPRAMAMKSLLPQAEYIPGFWLGDGAILGDKI